MKNPRNYTQSANGNNFSGIVFRCPETTSVTPSPASEGDNEEE